MANKKTTALTFDEFKNLVDVIRSGSEFFKPSDKIATALTVEANLGLRIGDILELKLNDIRKDGNRYALNIREEKTGKARNFTVPFQIYQFIENYCLRNNIPPSKRIFNITPRSIQRKVQKACAYLGLSGKDISTHSFRKFFSTSMYNENGHDIVLVQQLLQHSSPSITQRYIGIQQKQVEDALNKHIYL